jgi:hypothetical protein
MIIGFTMEKKIKSTTGLLLLGGLLLAIGAVSFALWHFKHSTPIGFASTQKETPRTQQFGFADEKPSVTLPSPSEKKPSAAMTTISPSSTQTQAPDAKLPSGFGIETGDSKKVTANDGDLPPIEAPKRENIKPPKSEEAPVNLETPMDAPTKKQDIQAIDPRNLGITANDGPEKDYEETLLTVQRTLSAVMENGDKQFIRLKVPVMYKSRTLRLDDQHRKEAWIILKTLKAKQEELAGIKKDLEDCLTAWNRIVSVSTPYEVLLPESPTIPQNQSANKLNREENPNMAPGKAISYEIVPKTK